MKTYTFINDHDGNDTFSVEANSSEEAMHKALEALGWNGPSEGEEDEDDEDQDEE